jgi:hypothetical protein
MKKNAKQNPTTETALSRRSEAKADAPVTVETAPAAPAAETPAPQQQQQERKPDFYERLMTSRPEEAAGILATLCRRKDRALRVMVEAHNAGKDAADCIRIALSIAFPKHKEAAG